MNRLPRRATFALLTLFVILILALPALARSAALQPNTPRGGGLALSLETHVPPGALEGPVNIAHAGDARLFVVERGGRVRIVRPNGAVDPTPFLNISARVRLQPGTEQGLLGLAFHPNYAQNGLFFVNYTAEPHGDTHIARFRVSADPDVADAASELLILEVHQPYTNHNAGDLLFGPHDGYLYIPLGDGGSGNDPQNRAQNMQALLGKLLRIDVDARDGSPPDCGSAGDAPGAYTIPADNPFVDGQGGDCDEIWALGLRNPWRASFDRLTADLYMGDVGQFDWEEIDYQPASSSGGENYGWSCFEGAHANPGTNMPTCQEPSAYDMPIFEINQDQNGACAVTGGYVYRGARFPEMVGHYFLSDLCAPYIWDLQTGAAGWNATRHDNMQGQLGGIVSFGEDVHGELYLAQIGSGAIYHLVEDTSVGVAGAAVLLPAFFKQAP